MISRILPEELLSFGHISIVPSLSSRFHAAHPDFYRPGFSCFSVFIGEIQAHRDRRGQYDNWSFGVINQTALYLLFFSLSQCFSTLLLLLPWSCTSKQVCRVHRWDMEMIAIRKHSFTKPQGNGSKVFWLKFRVLLTFRSNRFLGLNVPDPADGSLKKKILVFIFNFYKHTYLRCFQKNLNKEVECDTDEKQRSSKIADVCITVRCSFRPPSVSAIWKTDLEETEGGGQENSCMFLRNPELELAV